jgi:hypothetical protein
VVTETTGLVFWLLVWSLFIVAAAISAWEMFT